MTNGLHFSGTYGDHDWSKIKANWTETANIFIDDWADGTRSSPERKSATTNRQTNAFIRKA